MSADLDDVNASGPLIVLGVVDKSSRKSYMSTSSLVYNGTLLHRQLYISIKHQILNGYYRVGDRLPTQEQLGKQYSVSRITVRRALADLQREGYIRNEHGVGAFVENIPSRRSAPDATLSFIEDMDRVVEETEVTVLTINKCVPPEDICRQLQLKPNESAINVLRIRAEKDIPLMLLDAWMPTVFEEKISRKKLQKHALYSLLVEGKENIGDAVQEINAELADPSVANYLKIEVNAPVLRITRLLYDNAKAPIQHLSIRVAAQRSRLLMKIVGSTLSTANAGHLVHDL